MYNKINSLIMTLLATALLAFQISPCFAQSKTSNTTLRIALPMKELQFDPQKIEDMYSMTVVNQLYSKLFRYTPDGQIRTDIVEKWNVSEDKLLYTFKIKQQYFSDNTPVTAKHIVNTLKRVFFIQSAIASDLSLIKGAQSYFKTKNLTDLKIQALDEKTLTIATEKPTSLLIYLLAVPDLGIQKIEDPTATIAIDMKTPFSGVYKMRSLTSEQLVLEKQHPSDLESSNPPQFIEFNLYTTINPELVAQGEISDTSSFMTFDEKSNVLANSKNWRPVVSEITNERFIVLNPNKIPKEVRQWLVARVDQEKLTQSFDDPSIVPAFGFIPNCLPGHLVQKSKIKKQSLNIKRQIELKITYGENLPYSSKFKEFLVEAWSHPKIKLVFDEKPIADYLKFLFQKKGDIIIVAKGLDYPEGFSVVSYFRSNIESNFFHIKNKKIDQQLDKASAEINDKDRAKIYEKIQEMVLQEATVIPLAFGSWKKYYWSNRVSEVPAHPIGIHFMPLEMIALNKL